MGDNIWTPPMKCSPVNVNIFLKLELNPRMTQVWPRMYLLRTSMTSKYSTICTVFQIVLKSTYNTAVKPMAFWEFYCDLLNLDNSYYTRLSWQVGDCFGLVQEKNVPDPSPNFLKWNNKGLLSEPKEQYCFGKLEQDSKLLPWSRPKSSQFILILSLDLLPGHSLPVL